MKTTSNKRDFSLRSLLLVDRKLTRWDKLIAALSVIAFAVQIVWGVFQHITLTIPLSLVFVLIIVHDIWKAVTTKTEPVFKVLVLYFVRICQILVLIIFIFTFDDVLQIYNSLPFMKDFLFYLGLWGIFFLLLIVSIVLSLKWKITSISKTNPI